MDDPERPRPESPSKRTLLKVLGFGGLAIATGVLPDKLRSKEGDRVIESHLVVIDFAPTEKVPGINQTEFPNNESNGLSKVNPLLAQKFLADKAGHGEKVANVVLNTFHKYCFQTDVDMIPLQSLIKPSSVENGVDELGNPKVTIDIEAADVIEALKNKPDLKVVNMSFQMGRVGLVLEEKKIDALVDLSQYAQSEIDENGVTKYYPNAKWGYPGEDGKTIFVDENKQEITESVTREELLKRIGKEDRIVEVSDPKLGVKSAYIGENASRNVEELYKVARNFPDKVFFVAAGNEKEDLRDLKQNQPKNVLFVGEWASSALSPKADVFGADIYVDNSELNLGTGSSFSTAYLSTLASIIYNRGYSVSDAKDQLEKASPIEEYGPYQVPDKARVFDPTMFKVS